MIVSSCFLAIKDTTWQTCQKMEPRLEEVVKSQSLMSHNRFQHSDPDSSWSTDAFGVVSARSSTLACHGILRRYDIFWRKLSAITFCIARKIASNLTTGNESNCANWTPPLLGFVWYPRQSPLAPPGKRQPWCKLRGTLFERLKEIKRAWAVRMSAISKKCSCTTLLILGPSYLTLAHLCMIAVAAFVVM